MRNIILSHLYVKPKNNPPPAKKRSTKLIDTKIQRPDWWWSEAGDRVK